MRWRIPLLALAAVAGMAAADPATPPPEDAIPAGPDGDAIRRGLEIITNTRAAAPQYAGNDLSCANCHLDAGRTPGAAPLWAAFGNFPVWRDKNKQMNSFEKRVQDCFIYSINGTPPLWGPNSYNWGAGMAQVEKAAAFIRANMPLGEGGSLSVQQAWDIAWYIDGQVRPQDPRFAGNLAATRAEHHNRVWSRYGTQVAGRTLGDPATTPPHHVPPGHVF